MAEVQVKDSGGKGGKVRSKKNSGRPDMTPMVDLGFLLLTFFIFTTTFSKPNMMKLNMPDKTDEDAEIAENVDVKESNTITIVMGKDDRIFWYQKDLASVVAEDLIESDYSEGGIRAEINKKRAAALDTAVFTVIIKPTDDATFENAVNILDEMEITGNKRFALVDLKEQEKTAYTERIAVPKVKE